MGVGAIYALCFPSRDVGYATGDSGHVFKTDNAGDTWTQLSFPDQRNLTTVYFRSADTGWIGAVGLISRTIDGGTTWETQLNNLYTGVNGFAFISQDTGFAVCAGGKIISTGDCGATWTELPRRGNENFRSIRFVSLDTGFISGASITLKTTDRGATWTELPSGFTLGPTWFVDSRTWFSLEDGTIFSCGRVQVTRDGGATWSAPDTMQFSRIFPLGSDTVIGVGYYGRIAKTIDVCSTWIELSYDAIGECLGGLRMISPETVLVWSDSGNIFKTVNGGNTWLKRNVGMRKDDNSQASYPYAPLFIDHQTVYALGNGDTVIKTTDGWDTWSKHVTGSLFPVSQLLFINVDTGYGVGGYGTIVRTNDGGNTWEEQNSNTLEDLKYIRFFNADTGYAFSVNLRMQNQVLLTLDGGNSWATRSDWDYLASFTDAHTAYILNSDTLYKTIDFTATWTPLRTGMRSYSFINSDTGYGLTTGDSLYGTLDGGATWFFVNSQITWRSIGFTSIDSGTGVYFDSVYGPREYFITVDGGLTWQTRISSYNEVDYALTGASGIIKTVTAGIGVEKGLVQPKPGIQSPIIAYPNPFNPEVHIVVIYNDDIEISGPMSLRVFNTTGRLVDDLSSQLPNGIVTWDASKFPSAIYVCRLVIGKKVFSKRLVLIK